MRGQVFELVEWILLPKNKLKIYSGSCLLVSEKEDKKRKWQIWLVGRKFSSKISEWNEVFSCGRNYEVYYFPKVKIKKSSGSCLISLFMKKNKIEEL